VVDGEKKVLCLFERRGFNGEVPVVVGRGEKREGLVPGRSGHGYLCVLGF